MLAGKENKEGSKELQSSAVSAQASCVQRETNVSHKYICLGSVSGEVLVQLLNNK